MMPFRDVLHQCREVAGVSSVGSKAVSTKEGHDGRVAHRPPAFFELTPVDQCAIERSKDVSLVLVPGSAESNIDPEIFIRVRCEVLQKQAIESKHLSLFQGLQLEPRLFSIIFAEVWSCSFVDILFGIGCGVGGKA
jgi:hypothetical protein